ncbi:peptide chain release factor N(5)-glutamine methyltransferase [Ornithinimicrobium sediminis]|uniref:peptide chain release factor N(5)-glutamine methyltransferase n=1 Tax=Ornithinimicrobium sediminis TaxID=2904603 RepID=UPI001E52ACF6|nr:peptide chain release factor N(5)-glutamine methyltransferase [Ornithinimicrobium sediminis]
MEQTLRQAAARLRDAGVVSARVDAELLLAHAAGTNRAELQRLALLGRRVPDSVLVAYGPLVDERARRVPLQHLTGTVSFAGLELAVGPGVFVPRPETELLVTLGVEALRGADAPVVVDLCTGCGAVALALKARVPGAEVLAVELSEHALAWAGENVARSGLEVGLRQGDARTAGDDLLGTVDLVTCNPPYIPLGAVPVDPEVRDHDPELALYGGSADGLAIPRAVAARAAVLLRPGGVLLMEHAEVQREALTRALRSAGVWREVADHDDLTGRPRVARAVRAGG